MSLEKICGSEQVPQNSRETGGNGAAPSPGSGGTEGNSGTPPQERWGEKLANLAQQGANVIADVGSGPASLFLGTVGAATDGARVLNYSIASMFSKVVQGSNLDTDWLRPYKYLYATKPTKKIFVFPLLNDISLNATNSWTDKEDDIGQGAITSLLTKYVGGGPGNLAKIITANVNELSNIMRTTIKPSDSANRMSRLELAKYYQFPTDGEKVDVTFTLFNTVRKGDWKKNFTFIFLFALRNKLLKLDALSFEPPYLYDIFIPGTKHLPLAFVSSFTAAPKGIMRNLPYEFTGADTSGLGKITTLVPVPEAWEITIQFESLLVQSANLMLSSIYDFPISVSRVGNDDNTNNNGDTSSTSNNTNS